MNNLKKDKLNKIINHARLYGFIYNSSEIYNGIKGVYDYGPYGVEMKNNIKLFWWEYMVRYRDNIVGIDTSILMNKNVWKSSGHYNNFNEYFIKKDTKIYKLEKFLILILNKIKPRYKKNIKKKFIKLLNLKKEKKIKKKLNKILKKHNLFNNFRIKKITLMFKTKINTLKNKSFTYLRPETAQGIFINLKNVINSTRMKIPFGIAQIGKSFRNEIITKEFIFRTKEFEQMEMQFFVYPGEENFWYKYWLRSRLIWHKFFKLGKQYYKIKTHKKLSHYTTYASDIEFKYINKFKELEGIHFRKDFDLKNHQKYSKKKLTIYDLKNKKEYYPYVIETSLGLDRVFYSILCKSIIIEKKRIFFKLPKFIAPIKIAILPLIKINNQIVNISKKIFDDLKYQFNIVYDDKHSIGKRYRIQDAIGTPFCVTIDKTSILNETVTIRNRDDMKQIRCKIDSLYNFFKKEFDISFFFKKYIKNV
ncbi:MAG: glycine--tRNA ligase [Candidatus Shikimatogenerans bostrichidophilus]|nr:MAG: glycine--tRNA ligase [Candidatus Shikimatogenerans bostrichidophilus]